jgi:K+-transporting ATPase KdpF subunit
VVFRRGNLVGHCYLWAFLHFAGQRRFSYLSIREVEIKKVSVIYLVAATAAVLLMFYLLFALLFPERFS